MQDSCIWEVYPATADDSQLELPSSVWTWGAEELYWHDNIVPTFTKSRGKIYMVVSYSLTVGELFWCIGQTFTQLSLSKTLLCKQINYQWRRKKDCTSYPFKESQKHSNTIAWWHSEKHNLWSLSSKLVYNSHNSSKMKVSSFNLAFEKLPVLNNQ